ncbi:hypothetical protein GOEFS_031_00060 [Gordonia effusa NBRC 100432]|uniref:Uncharacterized protein n=1 Tax=Gordonia effusa NBRC 100432 TaxID=1077974 RepID=H0QX46_9ACTN|nr:hypothetical protein [Gordonia effusa]GAB17397.1 hypothetical protein GOEFS_031_00060 [Gordonia effusa NBRC 100432]
MQGLAAVLFPAMLMLFALTMEKLQTRIDQTTETVSDDQVDEILAAAQSQAPAFDDAAPSTLDDLRSRRAS